MNPEIHVYDNESTYKNVLGNTLQVQMRHIKLQDFYVKRDDKDRFHLWVVCDAVKDAPRPDPIHTIVQFFGGKDKTWFGKQYPQGQEPKLVEWNQVVYNPKNNCIEFGKQGMLKRPYMYIPVTRVWGKDKPTKKVMIPNDNWFFDYTVNHINLIVKLDSSG